MIAALHDHDGKLSFTRIFPALVVGSVFTVWLAYAISHLVPFLPPVQWELVEGYFEWIDGAFLPSVLPLSIAKTGDAIGHVRTILDKRGSKVVD